MPISQMTVVKYREVKRFAQGSLFVTGGTRVQTPHGAKLRLLNLANKLQVRVVDKQ